MKFTCNKSDMTEAVNIVLKAVPGKTTMPILECVVIEAAGDQIKLTTNDMQLGIETRFPAQIEEDGIILVNAKMISDIIRKLPENDVYFEADDNENILLFCGKAKFNLSGKNHEEFPMLPNIEKSYKITVSQFTLKEMIRQTIFSISNNESNKILTGELFEINGDEFKIASLDLHRVSIRKIQLKESYDDMKAVIPGKTLSEVSKILTGGMDDNVDIYFTKNHVLFELENTIIISRLIEGNFYNINQMLTNDYETKVTVNKRDLLECIDRATLLLREAENKPHDPVSDRIVVIEINPRTSRSSALASKATGFPIALVSAMLASGLTLDEIPCGVNGTLDKYVPGGDYIVIKFARWAFEKFKDSEDKLGTQMRAVGEVMSIGKNYKEAFQKAIRSLEIGRYGLGFAKDFHEKTKDELMQMLIYPTSERQFIMYEALRKGATVEELFERTQIKHYFIEQDWELFVG